MSDSSEEEAEFDDKLEEEDDEDDDDMPLASLKSPERRRSSTKKNVSYADDDSDDDSEDDIPLSALAPKTPPKNAAKKRPPAKKKAASKKSSSPATKKRKPTSSDKSYDTASSALYGTECVKGLLIQRLLCRWWYALQWPRDIPDEPPAHHDKLDGFPGVFVCTSGDKVGTILDFRNHQECPSFKNFSKKESSELKELLLKALEEQKKALIAHEGSGTATENELNKLTKWATKVNAAKAEKEAANVLKSNKIK